MEEKNQLKINKCFLLAADFRSVNVWTKVSLKMIAVWLNIEMFAPEKI